MNTTVISGRLVRNPGYNEVENEKGLQQISDSLLQKLMTGIMSCLHGKHQRCSEMKTLVMVLSGHWSRF